MMFQLQHTLLVWSLFALSANAFGQSGFRGLVTGDDFITVYVNGEKIGVEAGDWKTPKLYFFPAEAKVIALEARDVANWGGIIGAFSNGVVTNTTWKCTNQFFPNWAKVTFNDTYWSDAVVHLPGQRYPIYNEVAAKLRGFSNARWIWTADLSSDNRVFCRKTLPALPKLPFNNAFNNIHAIRVNVH